MEHRFYGNSIPKGPTISASNLGLLSIEQAMADYANLISITREKYNCPQCPVVAGVRDPPPFHPRPRPNISPSSISQHLLISLSSSSVPASDNLLLPDVPGFF
jgi:hypothetical protein